MRRAIGEATVMVGSVVPFVVIVLVVGGVAYGVRRYQQHQDTKLRAIAAAHGLEVDVGTKRPPRLEFDLFQPGSGKKVRAQMWRAGEQDSVFQYEYSVKSGERSTTYRVTAALVAIPFHAPHLEISNENWWSKIKRAVGMRDIEVESPEFNERYQVRCRDDRFAITLLDPAMIAWLLSPGSGRGTVTFELRDTWMLCHCDQLDVEALPSMLTWAQSVRVQLPSVLTELYGSDRT